jgi:hypothetical protein
MQTKTGYESILGAVGRVLDQTGVHSIAVREVEDGLIVEGLNGKGQVQVQLTYSIADLHELLAQAEGTEETALTQPVTTDEGTLRRFLAEHNRELVGAR